ncbi:hypothetical protein [Alteraurantiacibacter aquimixticola]|uniref:Uncharacterized protein n=1 Tax=Alteraurantiacibacter aquimixticola TaxID=2489173 RepID=A0A4T3F0M7_9SPHN|nr:hypothetical protein [Alteraurantiacibacter aquimixticola]TIX50621.1 hypothetical protein E5222_10210 [Alteraurantiacibacter aquimixticola]
MTDQTLSFARMGKGQGMEETIDSPDWVMQAHGLSDDVTSDEAELLAELAGVVDSWPARNIVTRRALHEAAMALLNLASENGQPAA